ncbi:hypothetical protein HYPSUDRAFT_724379 [Hypholoma sublateritium FD-334 SS-4]|uniref:RRM domain-containing protein n=1 Tax=Hypholoma sublateritium (strain FD-334 SS-4) TaxID=945553 RepID=A0A0D2NYH6_HYPSF|nr:hypothetical protein HYPSUDRAFT_724379 [Hypholoma sublateritium FD-334 SS-4]
MKTTAKTASHLTWKSTSPRSGCMIRPRACMFLADLVSDSFHCCFPLSRPHECAMHARPCQSRRYFTLHSGGALRAPLPPFRHRLAPRVLAAPRPGLLRIYHYCLSPHFNAHIFMYSRSSPPLPAGDPPIRANGTTLAQQPADASPVIPAAVQFAGGEGAALQTNGRRLGGADLQSTKSLSPLSFAARSSAASPHLRTLHPNQYGATCPIGSAKSPQLPAAPVHATIPLPHVDERGFLQSEDARRLQHLQQHQEFQDHQQQQEYHSQHVQQQQQQREYHDYQNQLQQQHQSIQQQHEHEHELHDGAPSSSVHNNDTIDLAGLSLGGGGGGAFRGAHALGLPAAHAQPALTLDAPYDAYAGMGLGPVSGLPASASDGGLGGAHKTPNVYINGLPPHFREDQLHDLTAPFGEIRSVRTFTRHVRDSESGYGFVLFATIDAAERCILSLRRYRNLHPTFSKQIHKIPGTTYAQGAAAASSSPATIWNEHGLNSDAGSNFGSNEDSLGQEASFKAKMESLADPTSTNLYMEGLPLSLDETTLAALVAPHVIHSSRLFHTKLSNPPRIIAFVRLETRKGAEEIIERLHGRMVRGWNDTGSRISVRFADTAEQRELRRTERAAQEGDASPARLTIAQASLLNLRGQELGPGQSIPAAAAASARGFATSVSAPEFASNAAYLAPELEVDYSLAPGRALARTRSPYPPQQALGYQTQQQQQPDVYAGVQAQRGYALGHSPTPPMDPAMAALINSLGGAGAGGAYGAYGEEAEYGQARGHVAHQHQHPHQHGAEGAHPYARAAPVYTRSGYTPTEEYIMRAHAESAALAQQQQQQQQQAERRRPAPLDLRRRRGDEAEFVPANIAVGVRGYRAQAAVGRLLSPPTTLGALPSPTGLGGMGMGMPEDEFHAAMRSDFGRALNRTAGDADTGRVVGGGAHMHTRHNANLHPAHVNARLARDQIPASVPSAPTGYAQQQQQHQQAPAPVSPPLAPESPALGFQHAAAHMRSTTLPPHRTSAARDGQQQQRALAGAARGHYAHSSMSMPAQSLRTPQHASVAAFGGAGGIDGGTIYEDGAREEGHQQHQQQQTVQSQTQARQQHQQAGGSAKYSPGTHNVFGDLEASSPTGSLISPTLTYGTQTPSTLSPATPFFGSFSSQGEGFEKGAPGMEGAHQKKPNGTGAVVGSTPLRS